MCFGRLRSLGSHHKVGFLCQYVFAVGEFHHKLASGDFRPYLVGLWIDLFKQLPNRRSFKAFAGLKRTARRGPKRRARQGSNTVRKIKQ